ncbi:anhydro-N-acetylmuramic acid kinase [Microbaculum marinum]|uniref:Anhydro-N-acetylmuramic acid kinase n=1 Tax=Microbaculum marinum TaxID=1764581 RepID=A0AAW9RND4_9HYPH
MTEALTAVGLMSGTSMDGVDVALIETDGVDITAFGPTSSRPYLPAERQTIAAAVSEARGMTHRTGRGGVIGEAERVVTEAHGEAVETFLRDNGIEAASVDVVGFHGQTILHRPERQLTVQLGDGQGLADRLGIDVVYDLRAADVAAGGQGAPFVPVFHKALAARTGLRTPIAILNLGGVGNVTWVGDGDPMAFDTGPGNALLDDWVQKTAGRSFDEDGRLAAAGTVDNAILARLMGNPYFDARPPKSLDRNDFDIALLEGLGVEDGAATLAAFTAASGARSAEWFAEPVRQWIVVGGGARNPTILAMLAARVDAPVTTGTDIGWLGDHVEAQAFAYLAVRSLRGLPLSYPTTTGVPGPLTGGVLVRAAR